MAVGIHLVNFRQLLSCGQNVAHAIKNNSNSLVILGSEEVAEGLENTFPAQLDYLRHSAAAGQVGDGPGSLLLSLEVALDQDVDQRLKNSGVHHNLDLITVAGGDVAHSPGGLLDDVHLGVLQQFGEHWHGLGGEDSICLRIVASHNVAESPALYKLQIAGAHDSVNILKVIMGRPKRGSHDADLARVE